MTKRDLQVYDAYQELMAIAESDIRSADGSRVPPRLPSRKTLEVYSETVDGAEAEADAEAELFQ